jgi:hypothetical protein
MARTGLTKSQVRACRDQLRAEGRYPSVDSVRQSLGNTGSKSTIHKYLKELDGEDSGAVIQRSDTTRTLLATVEQLADQLHSDAERQVRAVRAEYEEILRLKEEELAELRGHVALLTAQLEQRQDGGVGIPGGFGGFADHPRIQSTNGFGNFTELLSPTRGGGRDISLFSMIPAGGRSEVFDFDSVLPAARQFPPYMI